MVLGQIQERHHHPNVKNEKHHSCSTVGPIEQIHVQRQTRHMISPPYRWEKPHATFGQREPQSGHSEERLVCRWPIPAGIEANTYSCERDVSEL